MPYQIISQLTSPTSDALDFQGLSLSNYGDIQIKIDGITVGTDGADLRARFYIGGTLITSGYRYLLASVDLAPNTTQNDSTSSTAMPLTLIATNGIGNATNETFSALLMLGNATDAYHKFLVSVGTKTHTNGEMRRTRGTGFLANTGTLDGLRFFPSSGTLTAGKATIFGIPLS